MITDAADTVVADRSRSRFRVPAGTALAVVLALIACEVMLGTTLASPAMACGAGEDINILCPNEQRYLDELAAIGITPKTTPRELANTGSKICGYLINAYLQHPSPTAGGGLKNGVASTMLTGNPEITWDQAQEWVQAAVDNMCRDDWTGMHLQ